MKSYCTFDDIFTVALMGNNTLSAKKYWMNKYKDAIESAKKAEYNGQIFTASEYYFAAEDYKMRANNITF